MQTDLKMEEQSKLSKVKKEIRALLISSPVGLRLQELLDDYRAMLGKHLPFQELGYASALDMIKHMPDVAVPVFRAGGVMYLKGVADSSTRHIKQLVEQQKKNKKLTRIRKPPDESVRRPPEKPTVPYIVRIKVKELMMSYADGLEVEKFSKAYAQRFGQEINHHNLNFPSLKKLLEACCDIVEIGEKYLDGVKTLTVYLKKDIEQKIPINHAKVAGMAPERQPLQIPRFRKLPGSKTSSITGQINANTPSSLSAHSSKDGKVKNLWDIEGDSSVLNAIEAQKASNEEKPVIKIKSGVSNELKLELMILLTNRVNGMWLARLPFEYKRKFGKDLDVKSSGYLSLIEMLSSMPDTINIQRPVENGDWLLSEVKKGPDLQLPIDDCLPKNAVGYSEKFCKLSHPTDGQMEIFIVHIRHPGSFNFHWYKKKPDLDKLAGSIRSFYNSTASQRYLLPVSMRKVGQACCALYCEDGEWYRAQIIRSISDQEVEVMYVDYGNHAIVQGKDLRLLKKDFLSLPCMSIGGCLANIRPKNSDTWSMESRSRFFELTSDRLLTGKIDGFENDSVLLQLTDKTSKHHVHVNDTLVVEGKAVYKNQIMLQPQPAVSNEVPGYGMAPNQMQSIFNQMVPKYQLPAVNAAINMEIVQKQLAALNPVTASMIIPFLFSSIQQGINPDNVQNSINNTNLFTPTSNLFPGQAANPIGNTNVSVDSSQHEKSVPETVSCQDSPSEENLKTDHSALSVQTDSSENEQQFSSEISEPEVQDETVQSFMNVKKLAVPESEPYIIHVINFDGKPYVASGEIAALFWHGDILRAMLRKEKVGVSREVIAREDHATLFNELIEQSVKGVSDASGTKEHLTIYELESLPKIMDIFKHRSEVLKKIIKNEIVQYKNDPGRYWQAVPDDSEGSTDEIEEDSMSLELQLEELRLLLQAMQFRRKRLKNRLVGKSFSTETADELGNVEEEIDRIRKQIQLKEEVVI